MDLERFSIVYQVPAFSSLVAGLRYVLTCDPMTSFCFSVSSSVVHPDVFLVISYMRTHVVDTSLHQATDRSRHHHTSSSRTCLVEDRWPPNNCDLNTSGLCEGRAEQHHCIPVKASRIPLRISMVNTVMDSVESRMNCTDNNHVTGLWNSSLDASRYRVDSR